MMEQGKIYIQVANQISIQKPLSEEWMVSPLVYDEQYVRAIDPDFRDYISPLEARRMGKLLKRALAVTQKTLKDAKTECPDAIITGTGLGCIWNTEQFLEALCNEGEELQKPTLFMQSTHNTISSQLAIRLKCHGYNTTYSHKGMSFDSALLDAFIQMRLGMTDNAIVGANDEMSPSYFGLLQRVGYVGGNMKGTCGEAAVSMYLNTQKVEPLCELSALRIVYRPTIQRLEDTLLRLMEECGILKEDIDVVVTGVNGKPENDIIYNDLCDRLFPGIPLMCYKRIFGECYSSSAFATYAAAHCLRNGFLPENLHYGMYPYRESSPKIIFVFNQYEKKNFSFTVLKACGD